MNQCDKSKYCTNNGIIKFILLLYWLVQSSILISTYFNICVMYFLLTMLGMLISLFVSNKLSRSRTVFRHQMEQAREEDRGQRKPDAWRAEEEP